MDVDRWLAAKEWVNIYFYRGHRIESALFEPSANPRMRTVRLRAGAALDEPAFAALVAQVAAVQQLDPDEDDT